MQVLIGQKAKELVLDDRAADGSSEDVTVQLRNFVAAGTASSCLKKKGAALSQLVPRCKYKFP